MLASPPRSPRPSTHLYQRQRQPAASSAIPSQTQTETAAPPDPRNAIPAGTLRIRATAAPNDDRRIRWAEDVVDNEGMGKKKSKGRFEAEAVSGIEFGKSNGAKIRTGRRCRIRGSGVVSMKMHKLTSCIQIVCCIYHAPRAVGESSSESSSESDSSSSDSDSESDGGNGDDGRARMGGKGKGKKRNHDHDHEHWKTASCGGHGGGAKRKGKRKNAYENQPKVKKGQCDK